MSQKYVFFSNQHLDYLAKSVDPDQPASLTEKLIRIYNVFEAVFTKLHDLVDVRVTYIHLLKKASDGNSYLLFGKENYGTCIKASWQVLILAHLPQTLQYLQIATCPASPKIIAYMQKMLIYIGNYPNYHSPCSMSTCKYE